MEEVDAASKPQSGDLIAVCWADILAQACRYSISYGFIQS